MKSLWHLCQRYHQVAHANDSQFLTTAYKIWWKYENTSFYSTFHTALVLDLNGEKQMWLGWCKVFSTHTFFNRTKRRKFHAQYYWTRPVMQSCFGKWWQRIYAQLLEKAWESWRLCICTNDGIPWHLWKQRFVQGVSCTSIIRGTFVCQLTSIYRQYNFFQNWNVSPMHAGGTGGVHHWSLERGCPPTKNL